MWSPRLYEKRGGSVSTRLIFPLGIDNPMKIIAKHEVGIDVSRITDRQYTLLFNT